VLVLIRAVIELYQKNIFRLAYAFFHNHDDAMDIVQETFLRLYSIIKRTCLRKERISKLAYKDSKAFP